MKKSYIIIGVIVVIIIAIIGFIIGGYNNLVTLEEEVDGKYADIEVQLERRADLIPNLVNTVQGYVDHEEAAIEKVTTARENLVNADGIEEQAEANNELSGALSKLLMLSESYPDLKANENFLSLQNDLKETEDKITYSRQFYNDSAMDFNNIVEMFPSNTIASIFKFKKFEYFKIDEKEKETPKVKF